MNFDNMKNPVNLISDNVRLNHAEIVARKVHLRSTPLQVNIELTGMCNIRPPCVYCTGKNFGHDYPALDWHYLDKYARFLDRCQQVNEDSFGEPLTHPKLVELAQRVTARGQRFSFVTNGLLLRGPTAEGLVGCGRHLAMHISFNAATASTYYKLTGRDFDGLVSNARRYVALYKAAHRGTLPIVALTFIVMRINHGEVCDFLDLARELEVGALLATLHDRPSIPVANFGYNFIYEDEMLSADEYAEIGKMARLHAKKIGLRKCLVQWDPRHDSAIRKFAGSVRSDSHV